VSDAYAFDRARVQLEEVTVAVTGVERTFRYVDHNGLRCPIVAEDGDTVYAVCTPYQHDGGGIDVALYQLLHATDVRGACDALRDLGMFPQNVMVADRTGGCWYVRAGRVPKRAPHIDYGRPLDGHDPKADWQGVHTIEDLVQLDGPPDGYLQNCNVAPDTMFAGAADSALSASNYAPYLFNVAPGMTNSRGERATELLSRCTSASIDDLQAIATEEYWIGTERWLDVLRTALEQPADDLAILLAFDGVAAADSRGALIYSLWREAVVDLTDIVDGGEPLTADQQRTLVDAARRAVADAGEATYGERFRIRRAGGRSWPGRAGFFARHRDVVLNDDIVAPLRVMLFGPADGDGIRWEAGGGRSLRLTILGDRARSWSVVLYGQSGDPASPHYDDQIALYSERRMRDTRFDDPQLWNERPVTTLAASA
jgi:acyl-homoserine lactone acylase PvdQ